MPAVSKRTLPKHGNPLIDEANSPALEQLVERRRLGRTNLSSKTGVAGLATASRSESLGPFDYAHLRVPLPKDLKGSGIFGLKKQDGTYTDSYFLMRRSSDGFVSATGMFKAAFPWATTEEEAVERKYHQSLPSGGAEEVAGNVWVHPDDAIDLADDYNMRLWILALVHPEPIEKGNKSPEKDEIATPPRFVFKDLHLPPPSTAKASIRKRSTRSQSPSKIATPSRKIASPRKPRTTRRKKADDDTASQASVALQNTVENGTADSMTGLESTNGGAVAPVTNGTEEVVKVSVDEVVTKEGEKEVTKTSVVIDMPAGHPDLPLPDNTEDMMAAAKAIVEKATAEDATAAQANGVKPTRKRKAAEVAADDERAEASGAAFPNSSDIVAQPAAKKTKTAEEALKTSKVRNRAFFGVGLTLAIGAAIPYFL